MAGLARTGFSIDRDLLGKFDAAISGKGYKNRSEAVRDLMRDHLVSEEADKNKVVAGTLTIVYDHHRSSLMEKLMELQHRHAEMVVSTMHVHLDHDNCLEVIVLRGQASALQQLAAELSGLKGIHKGQLVLAKTTGTP